MKLKIAANTLVQIIGKIISSGSSFLVTILLARTYGPVGYGDFEKITAFVFLFYLVVDFGFNAIVLNKIRKKESTKEALYGLVLGSRIILGAFVLFLCLSLLPFLPGSSFQGYTGFVKLGIILISPTIFLQGLISTNNLLFQENLRYDKSILASSLSSLFFLALVYLVSLFNLPLIFVLFSFLSSSLMSVFLSFYLVRSFIISFVPVFNFNKIFSLIKETLPFGITLVFNILYFRGDLLLLTMYKSTTEVAYYGLAYRFFEFALVFPTFFNNALYPILLEKKEENFEKAKNLFLLSCGFLLGVGLIAGLMLFLASPYLISLTSNSFTGSVASLRILSVSLPVFYLTNLFMWFLIAFDRQKLLAPIYGFVMIINLALNYYFIPSYSYLASSVITGITETFILVISGYYVIKTINKNSEYLQKT